MNEEERVEMLRAAERCGPRADRSRAAGRSVDDAELALADSIALDGVDANETEIVRSLVRRARQLQPDEWRRRLREVVKIVSRVSAVAETVRDLRADALIAKLGPLLADLTVEMLDTMKRFDGWVRAAGAGRSRELGT